MEKTTTIAFDAASGTITTTSPESREVVRTIDTLGRTTEVKVGPPVGMGGFHPLRFEYDASGRLDFIRQGVPGVDERVTDLQYDANGNLASIIDPIGTTTMLYDDANRVETITRPDTQQIGFGYDANGNLEAVTPPMKPTHGFTFTTVDQERLYQPPSVVGIPFPDTLTSYDLDRLIDDVVLPDQTLLDFVYHFWPAFSSPAEHLEDRSEGKRSSASHSVTISVGR